MSRSKWIRNAGLVPGDIGWGRLLRLSFCAAVLVPAFYGSLSVYGLGPNALFNGRADVMEHQPATQAQMALAARLDEDLQRVDAWSAARWRIVDEVINQQLTLHQAADAMRELGTKVREPHPEVRRATYPGPNDMASYAKQLVDHIRARLQDQPDKAAQVVARLQSESVALAR